MSNEDLQHDDGSRRCERTGMGRRARFGVAAAALIGIGAALGALATLSTTAAAHFYGGRHLGSVERLTERALDRTAWVMSRLDASEEQEQQMNTLVTTLVHDLVALRGQHVEHRRAIVAELLADAPDRGRLEGLRREELRLADIASARLLDAAVEAAGVLTPAQRDELLEFASRRGHHH